MTQPQIKQASLYRKTDTKVICLTCQRNCPNCNELLIERYGFSLTTCRITPDKRCYFCREEIPIIGALPLPVTR